LNTTSDINSVYEYTVPLFTRDSDVFVVVIREGNDDKRGTLRKCENIIQQARRNPAIIAVYQVSEKNPLPEIPREVDDWCNEHGGSCICVELNSENSVADKASKHHAQDFSESTYADKTGKDDEQDFSESTDVDKTSKHHAQKDFSKVTHATSFGVERAVKGIDDLFREINKRCIEKIEGHEKPGGVDIAAAADATAGEVPPSCC
jgi:hypothetical protein